VLLEEQKLDTSLEISDCAYVLENGHIVYNEPAAEFLADETRWHRGGPAARTPDLVGCDGWQTGAALPATSPDMGHGRRGVLVAPHLYGAPRPTEYKSAAPESLPHEFTVITAVTSLLFWIILGILSGFVYNLLGPFPPNRPVLAMQGRSTGPPRGL
jgi:hypothetical protein